MTFRKVLRETTLILALALVGTAGLRAGNEILGQISFVGLQSIFLTKKDP